MAKTPYATLFSASPLSGAEAKRRHRFLVSQLHPDKFAEGSYEKELAEQCIKEINNAWSILRDSKNRRIVDMITSSILSDWTFSLDSANLLELLRSNRLEHSTACEVYEFVLDHSFTPALFENYVSYLIEVRDFDRILRAIQNNGDEVDTLKQALPTVLERLIVACDQDNQASENALFARKLMETAQRHGIAFDENETMVSMRCFLEGDNRTAQRLCHQAVSRNPRDTRALRLLLHYVESELDGTG